MFEGGCQAALIPCMGMLQKTVNTKRTNQSDLMLGPAQIAWVEEQTEGAPLADPVDTYPFPVSISLLASLFLVGASNL